MITALKKNKFTQTLATGTAAIGVLAGSMLITSSANAVTISWADWSSGTPLIQGDKTVTFMSKSADFNPVNINESSVELILPIPTNDNIHQFTWYTATNQAYSGNGSFTYKIQVTSSLVINGIALNAQTAPGSFQVQKFVCAGTATTCDGTNDLLTLTSTNGSPDPATGFASTSAAQSFVITDSFTANGSALNSSTNSFQQTEVPEPLTILGTGVVLGALPVLKKEYAKRKKKKDGNA